ncbi:hypothetical protein ACJ73_10051 [Blastomyces percursus]|uniref:Myb-like domain-containing protein n=1 Tax=Blastomyces percursus TaxID=1658174 RepID=A0A1J9P0I3_9EURO|nr:hypothetical protein ACJ73_10051 [Blastomyces percursus]
MEKILRTMMNPGGLLLVSMCAPVPPAEGLWVHLPARKPNRSLELLSTPALGKCAGRWGGDACDTRMFESRFLPRQTLSRKERAGDRSDLSDNSDFKHSSDCSSGDDDETYRESDDDDNVARRPRKQRKLWTRRSSRSVVTSAACTGDPSPAAVVDDKPGKRNPTLKHSENPAGDSSSVSTVSLDDAATNHAGDNIPVSGFLSSSVAGSRVCYTITFCHEETARLLSATANDLSSPGREGRRSVATDDDALLKELKEDGEPWDEITKRFPGRSKATLQVRYSTKLKHRTPPTRKSKSTSRPRKHGCR